MGRHLFVVRRDQASLRDYLTPEFAQEPEVEVIVDRRVQERRCRAAEPPMRERRGGEPRRGEPPTDDPGRPDCAFVRVE